MDQTERAIAIYSRKSKFTGKGESIGNQVELCRAYVRNAYGEACARRCAVFEDEGFSGGDLQRPDFQRMLAQVRQRRFRAIVVYRLDRISRNISDFTGLIDELTKLDVSFVSIKEQFDTGTPMGRAMMFIISVFSQLERETIAERIRDNMLQLAKTGRWLGGNTPIGFQSTAVSKVSVDGKERRAYTLTPVPGEIEIPRLIFDLYTRLDSLTAVEAELLRRQIKTKQGRDFSRFAVKAILQNPVYMAADEAAYAYFTDHQAQVCFPESAFDGSHGIMAYNRTSQEKGRSGQLLPVSAWLIAIGRHPGVIPSRQWIQVQISLDRNRSKAYRKPRSNEALLTGLLYCACGARMYPKLSQRTNASGDAVYTYVCKMKERSKGTRCACPNASGNLLDGAVMAQICALPEDTGRFLSQLARQRTFYAGRQEPRAHQLDSLRAACAANEQTLQGLVDSLGMVGQSPARPRIVTRIEELTRTNQDLALRIRELEAQDPAPSLGDVPFAALCQDLACFPRAMDGLAIAEKRAAVQAVVCKVIWDGANAHVLLFGDPLPGE